MIIENVLNVSYARFRYKRTQFECQSCSGKGWCVCSVLTNDNSDVYETI